MGIFSSLKVKSVLACALVGMEVMNCGSTVVQATLIRSSLTMTQEQREEHRERLQQQMQEQEAAWKREMEQHAAAQKILQERPLNSQADQAEVASKKRQAEDRARQQEEFDREMEQYLQSVNGNSTSKEGSENQPTLLTLPAVAKLMTRLHRKAKNAQSRLDWIKELPERKVYQSGNLLKRKESALEGPQGPLDIDDILRAELALEGEGDSDDLLYQI